MNTHICRADKELESQWSDYYDELKSRRYRVAAFFHRMG
jgi:hypothetical protein